MSLKQAVHNNTQLLSLLRDELRVQSHLFRAEARERWQQLERRWAIYQDQLARIRKAAADATPEVRFAFEQLEDALRHEYTEFRDTVKRKGVAA